MFNVASFTSIHMHKNTKPFSKVLDIWSIGTLPFIIAIQTLGSCWTLSFSVKEYTVLYFLFKICLVLGTWFIPSETLHLFRQLDPDEPLSLNKALTYFVHPKHLQWLNKVWKQLSKVVLVFSNYATTIIFIRPILKFSTLVVSSIFIFKQKITEICQGKLILIKLKFCGFFLWLVFWNIDLTRIYLWCIIRIFKIPTIQNIEQNRVLRNLCWWTNGQTFYKKHFYFRGIQNKYIHEHPEKDFFFFFIS